MGTKIRYFSTLHFKFGNVLWESCLSTGRNTPAYVGVYHERNMYVEDRKTVS